jgi:hypothetical protein
VVQWGVSPHAQTAGTRAIPYASLVKPGTLAARADAATQAGRCGSLASQLAAADEALASVRASAISW